MIKPTKVAIHVDRLIIEVTSSTTPNTDGLSEVLENALRERLTGLSETIPSTEQLTIRVDLPEMSTNSPAWKQRVATVVARSVLQHLTGKST